MKETYRHSFIQAGLLAGRVRAFGKALIQKGASYNAILQQVNQKILDLGAFPAFPPQMALNHVAAHFLVPPGEDRILQDELVKLDIGVCVDGAVGDCATSVDLSGRYQHVVDAAEAALRNAEKMIKVGLPIREIGKTIEATILSYGLQPVRNLCGHGLGFYRVHTAPLIPNYDDHCKGYIQPGMTFAIEPFATNGKGSIREKGNSTLFSVLKEKPLSSPLASQLLGMMKEFRGLPFSIHNLLNKGLSLHEVKQGLNILISSSLVGEYPPLVEEEGTVVAQAENSILVDAKGHVLVTTRQEG